MTLYPRAPASRRRGDGTAKTLEMTHFACELVPRFASALLCVLAAPRPPESSPVPSDPMAPMEAVSSRLQTRADSSIKARHRLFAVGAAPLLRSAGSVRVLMPPIPTNLSRIKGSVSQSTRDIMN